MLPILFHIGPWPVYTYGVMVSLGFIVGYYVLLDWAEEEGVDEKYIVDLFLILVGASMVGARITYVITYPQHFYYDWLDIFRVWKGGLTILGGALLALVLFGLYCWRHRLPTLLVLDLFSPCIALGLIIGRWGCVGYGCCYGRPTDLPWGLTFPNTDPLMEAVPRHPTQIYTSLCMVVIFLCLRWYRRRPHTDGMVTVAFIYLYSIYRLFIETLREDVATESYIFGLTFAQSCCLVASLGGFLTWFFWLRHRPYSRGEGVTPSGQEEGKTKEVAQVATKG